MDFYQKYYGQLVGFHIHRVSFEDDDMGGAFPILHIRHPDGSDLRLVLSSDEEGNGPGFAFIEEDA